MCTLELNLYSVSNLIWRIVILQCRQRCILRDILWDFGLEQQIDEQSASRISHKTTWAADAVGLPEIRRNLRDTRQASCHSAQYPNQKGKRVSQYLKFLNGSKAAAEDSGGLLDLPIHGEPSAY